MEVEELVEKFFRVEDDPFGKSPHDVYEKLAKYVENLIKGKYVEKADLIERIKSMRIEAVEPTTPKSPTVSFELAYNIALENVMKELL